MDMVFSSAHSRMSSRRLFPDILSGMSSELKASDQKKSMADQEHKKDSEKNEKDKERERPRKNDKKR